MKFWVYGIDWRSMAIEIIAECKSERDAKDALQAEINAMSDQQKQDMVAYRTVSITTASREMQEAVKQFKRLNGRAVA